MSDPTEQGAFHPALAAGADEPDEGGAGLIGVGADLPTGTSASTRLSNGSLILLLTVLVAGGVLYIMRQFGLGSGLTLVDMQIDYPIDGPKPSEVDEHRRVIAALRDSAHAVQVPLEEVKKNPFRLNLQEEDAAPVAQARPTISEEERRRRQRADLIQTTLAGLELNSVIAGSVPIARISGENVRVGDLVKGLFLVREIRGRSVVLSADGETYTLTMGGS
ncbi:MAG: hypothetical protein D6693_06555 [Planctomycetota bacterium]|nr:MAG: hypothetical protein D6693_06555 [Planctomycetota bacterium]